MSVSAEETRTDGTEIKNVEEVRMIQEGVQKKSWEQDVAELTEKGKRFINEVFDFANISYGSRGSEKNAELWVESKYALIKELRKSKYWDEDTLRLIIPVDYSYLKEASERRQYFSSLVESIEYYASDKGNDDLITASAILQRFINRRNNLPYPAPGFENELVATDEELLVIKEVFGYTRVQSGMKYSRLFQKLIESIDPDAMTDDQVASRYTKWTEALVLQKRNYKFVFSVNPADYLLMSYGNSWTSCHIIAPHIAREGITHEGMYKAGCLSYMVDEMTAMSFIVPLKTANEDITLKPRIARRVVFVNPEEQGYYASRIYPYADNEVYRKMFKETVQLLLADVFKDSTPRQWVHRSAYVEQANDLHYADYDRFGSVGESAAYLPTEKPSLHDLHFVAGAAPKCIECGRHEIVESRTLYCDNGCDPEMTYRCDDCDEYYSEDDLRVIEVPGGTRRVCDGCFEDRYRECNGRRCRVYINTDNEDEAFRGPDDEYYCESCYNDLFVNCDECGEVIRTDESYCLDDGTYCEECVYICPVCGEVTLNSAYDDNNGMCPDCYQKALEEEREAAELDEERAAEAIMMAEAEIEAQREPVSA